MSSGAHDRKHLDTQLGVELGVELGAKLGAKLRAQLTPELRLQICAQLAAQLAAQSTLDGRQRRSGNRPTVAARGGAGPLYDLIYVDEVQDMTQGELALLLQLSGLRHDRIFLAGDTAQSISYGVDFRFDEVRSVVHALCGGAVAPKPLTLSQNYRSHAGVLDIAAKVVDVMHDAFPHAADVLPRQGDRFPWRVHQNYLRDLIVTRYSRLEDRALQWRRRAAPP